MLFVFCLFLLLLLFLQNLYNRIVDYLRYNNLFSKEQEGFKKGFGRPPIYSFYDRLLTNIQTSRIVGYTSALLIFRELFGSVWHDAFLLKLHSIVIQGKCVQTIQDMYRNSSVFTRKKQMAFQGKHLSLGGLIRETHSALNYSPSSHFT